MAPIEASCMAEVERLEGLDQRRKGLEGLLQQLQKQAADLE
jgi:hypothetical protein